MTTVFPVPVAILNAMRGSCRAGGQSLAEIALGRGAHRHRRHIRAEHPPTVQDAVVIDIAIERGVIVPARHVIRIVEDWIDRAHTNPARDARRDGRGLLLLLGCVLVGQARSTPTPGRVLISIAQNQATPVTRLDASSLRTILSYENHSLQEIVLMCNIIATIIESIMSILSINDPAVSCGVMGLPKNAASCGE